MEKIRTYFMGSGDIAVPLLATLDSSGIIELVGICTQCDKPAGRKKVLTPTPIGQWCAENALPVDKPTSVNSPEFLAILAELKIDFIFVVSFGQILRQPLLDTPKIACVNLHASLLPLHRGASPIVSAILAGDSEVGVTFMKMDAGLDTGPEYARFAYSPSEECADEMEAILGKLGAKHVEKTLAKIAAGELSPVPQDDLSATHSGKIKKSDALIDWNDSDAMIARQVRAYHPWPGAHFFIETPKRKIKLTITSAKLAESSEKKIPGTTIQADKSDWIIACGDGALSITSLKPEGKNDMTAAEFLRGRPDLRNS